jgi:hypothetical protein
MLNIENDIKKEVFNLLIKKSYKFYINILPTEHLIVGKRGITEEEKEAGLLLVFSNTSYKNLTTDDNFIYCDMKFRGIWESLQIPFYAINYMVDDLYNPNYVFKFKITQPENIPQNNNDIKQKKTILKIVK